MLGVEGIGQDEMLTRDPPGEVTQVVDPRRDVSGLCNALHTVPGAIGMGQGVGTRRSSSENQFWTTTICVRPANGSSTPSADSSSGRYGFSGSWVNRATLRLTAWNRSQ